MDDRALVEDEILERNRVSAELWKWLKRQESYWIQQSREKWLKEGDRNTKYFHAKVTSRLRRSRLEQIMVNGELSRRPDVIHEAVFGYYKSLFREDWSNRPICSSIGLNKLGEDDASWLVRPVEEEEIVSAVWSCDNSTASSRVGRF